jgi:GTP-binding protein
MLTHRKKLAKISSRPGKTQLINHFLIDGAWFLVDLPGYGWAKVSKKEKEKWKFMINEYLQMRPNLINVFLLVDVRHEPQKIDLEFMKDLGMAGIPFSIVFTKADKQGKNQTASQVAFYKKVLKKYWDELPPQFISSSMDKTGREEILGYISQLNQSITQ